MTIGERVLDLVYQKDMTQKEFSEKTGIPQSTMSSWRGKKQNPSLDKLKVICDTLQVDPYLQKSLLDIAHPHPKYNFRPYWRDSYGMLQCLLDNLRRKVEVLRSENITSGIDEKGNPYVTFASEQVLVDFQKLNAEIRYLERLVRIRRFWQPRDWFQSIWNTFTSAFYKIQRRIERRKSKRIANMTEEKRLAYYRKRIRLLEKKIISIYDKE